MRLKKLTFDKYFQCVNNNGSDNSNSNNNNANNNKHF